MSKKKLRNRLESLFADLEQDASILPSPGDKQISGWTWECDFNGRYTACGPEVEEILGISSQDFLGQALSSFALHPNSAIALEAAIAAGVYPVDVVLRYQNQKASGEAFVAVSLHIFEPPVDNGDFRGLHGFAQVIETGDGKAAQEEPPLPPQKAIVVKPGASIDVREVVPEGDWLLKAARPQTPAGLESLERQKVSAVAATTENPATLGIPVLLQEQTYGLLEILDDTPNRFWSHDERRLVEQVADQLSLALENARLFQAEQQRANEMNTLVELSRLISQNLDLEEVYTTAHRIIGQLMATESFSINLIDRANNEFLSVYTVDCGVRLEVERFAATEGFSGHVAKTGQPYIIRDLDVETTPFPQVTIPGTETNDRYVHSVIAAPLRFSGEIIGVITTQSYTANAFNDHDLRLLQTFADHIAIAIQNARLFEQTQSALKETATLYSISSAASRSLDLEESLQELLSKVLEAIDFETGLISLVDDYTEKLKLSVHQNLPETLVERLETKGMDNTLCALVFDRKEPVSISSIEHQSPINVTGLVQLGLKAYVGVPLVSKDRIIGTLCAFSYSFHPGQESNLSLMQVAGQQIGIAVENFRLFRQTQARAEEFSILHQVSLELAQQQRDLNTLLEIITRRAMELLSSDGGGIWLWHEGEQELEQVISYPVGEASWAGRTLKPGEGLVGKTFAEGKIQVIEDYSSWAGNTEKPEHVPFHAAVAVPMVWQSTVMGALVVTRSERGHPFAPGEQSLAELLAGQASAVIQNARLYQQEQHRRQVADALREIARVVSSTLDLREVIERMLDQLSNLIQYRTASIQLIQKGRRQLIGGRGFDVQGSLEDGSALWRPISDDPLIYDVVQSRKPLLLSDTHKDPRWEVHEETKHVRSWVAAPLIVGQEVVGILTLDNDKPGEYTSETAEMATAVAAQAAVAIQNARLFQQSQETLAETETLYLASAELNMAQSYDDILDALRRHTLAGQDAHQVTLVFFDRPWTKTAVPEWLNVLARWEKEEMGTYVSRYPVAAFPSIPQLMRSDIPLLVEDIEHDSRLDENMRALYNKRFGAKSSIFVSIVVSGQWLGFINASFPELRNFPEAEVRRMSALVNQAGVAVQNLRNIELSEQRAKEAQKRSEELALINRVVSSVVSSPDLRLVLETMASELVDVFSLNNTDIALLNDQRTVLTVVAAKSSRPEIISAIGMAMPVAGNPSAQQVIDSKHSLLITDAKNNALTAPIQYILRERDVETMLLVPIISGGNVIGTASLNLAEKGRTFSPEEIRLAETLVAQLSTAIQNANLFEQIQGALAETETLYRASADLNTIKNYNDILEVLRKATILGHQSAVHVAIHLFDRSWKENEPPNNFATIARWTQAMTLEALNPRFQLKSWTTADKLFRPDVPTMIMDAVNDPLLDRTARALFIDQYGAKSLLITPLNVGGDWFGFISSVYTQHLTFPEQEVRRLMALAGQAAIAVQNQRLLDETRRRAAQLETAAEIARDTSGTLALDTLLRRAVNLIRDRYGYYHASIFLVDESGQYAIIRESTGEAGEEMKRRGHRMGVGSRSIIGFVTEEGKPLVINDVGQDPIHRPNPLLPDTRAEVGMPLKIGNRVIGALDVQSAEANSFNPDDISVLQTLADQIAVAVDNANSYELAQQAIQETRRRVQELSVLYSMGQSLATASMAMDDLGKIISEKFIEVMNFPEVSISLVDPDTGELYTLVDLSKPKDNLDSPELTLSDQVGDRYVLADFPTTMRVMRTLQPLVVQSDDASADASELAYMQEHDIKTMAMIPLAVKGGAIGIIELDSWKNPRNLTSDQLNLAVTMANSAAVALENARLYEEQRRVSEKLREVDKLKSQFLANMSHELRTPLNSIIGFSRVILKGIDGPVTDLQNQDLSAIHNSGTHLLSLINNVLDISKIEAGKMELAFDPNVNLADLINTAMSTAVGLVKDKPVKLEKMIAPDLPAVRADPTRIRQIVLNFLSNASKFTDEGTITVKADVQKSPDGHPEILVEVIDTGLGIAIKDQKRLFQPFSQVDESPTRKTGGSGLGLSISRLLVEMHGGRIGLNSDIGKGSTFWFTLPLPIVEPVEIEDSEKKIILSIDDERQVLNLYDRYLTEHGFKVVPLTDPDQAVQRAKEIKPFAITLDIMMPGRNGWQVLEALKNDPETRTIPIIICSIVEDQDKGFSLGATDYLTKPFLEDDLVGALNRLNGDGSISDVLVVDDDPDDLRLVEKIFQKQGRYQVRLAKGGSEGLVALRSKRPDAVILDLFMPGLDGFTLLETMRADQTFKDVPVIVFTAGDLTEEQQNRLANFSQDLLHKGLVKEEELLASIETALKRYSPPQ
ncbi:MAG: GAF domain-containing protein [Chloroflexota bacterium]|nr:MAG: GAF domain-containing protein [Chloroflexota bacterium]